MLDAKNMRKSILKMAMAASPQGAHLGGSLSLVEIMATLYGGIMRLDPANMEKVNRDRLILSKGHGALAQYAALAELGILAEEDLLNFKKDGFMLSTHPAINPALGIDFASGSLGQGLSIGVGVALGLRRKQDRKTRVFVILGDGECDEGQVWEAAMSAAHYKLDNLVAIVDENQLQSDGPTQEILDLGSLEAKWKSFGWLVNSVDGHNPEAIQRAITKTTRMPLVIIAKTIKGKGVSFIENMPTWHYGSLSKKLFEQAIKEVESDGAGV